MTVVLSDYLTDLRSQLNDPNNQFTSTDEMTRFINKARLRIAAEAQCIRVMPTPTGSVDSIAVTAGGSGYTSATVAISAPDGIGSNFVNATATATVLAGAVTAITVVLEGTGYVADPTVTISGDGTGATATATLTDFMHTVEGQEVYSFDTANTIIQRDFPGVDRMIALQSVAVSWGSWKPMLDWTAWSWQQAYARSNNITLQNYPSLWGQYAQGTEGTIYLFPLPSMVAQMEWDTFCLPIELESDDDIEAIPYPWTDAVVELAAYYAYKQAQRRDDAQEQWSWYERFLRKGRVYVQPSMVARWYGSG